ncbi:GNAT family N-acetyltransferase [Colwellia sp. 39_35_sub15_T18]|nr:GNAT family N-acetyltransferase [Colwellia sp. 39_35_sub15_T18]
MSLTDNFQIKLVRPTADEFLALREKLGWQSIAVSAAEMSLTNSLFHVTIYHDVELVAMGRIVGDGVMYFYIQDVVVDPAYQSLGVGAALMTQIESYLSTAATKGSTIGLLAAQGKEAFYARYGYVERPNTALGHGMCKFV